MQALPQMIAGESYGQVEQNQLAYDAARDSRYFQSLADQRSRERQASDAALQWQQLAQSREQNQAALAQAFAIDQGHDKDRAADRAQQESQFTRGATNALALENLRIKPYENKLGAREQLQTFNQAYAGIQNGSIKTPSDLEAFAGPNVAPQDLLRLHTFLNEAHNRLLTAFGQQQQAASNANQDYQRRVGIYEPAAKAAQDAVAAAPLASSQNWFQRHVYGPTSREDLAKQLPTTAGVSQYNAALNAFEQQTERDKMRQRQVEYDASRHTFVPLMPAPETWGSKDALTPAAAATPAAVPLTPTTPAAAAPPTADDGWIKAGAYELHPSAYAAIKAAMDAEPNAANKPLVAQAIRAKALQAGTARVAGAPGATAPSLGIAAAAPDAGTPDAAIAPATGNTMLGPWAPDTFARQTGNDYGLKSPRSW